MHLTTDLKWKDTWVFEPESFAPLAKLVSGEAFGIVTDHLGTPRAMFDEDGTEVWSADIDAYGDLRNVRGERQACPFRWPGQYEDSETGLYYNRFRYYDLGCGNYVTQDPLGILGGLANHAYVVDPLQATDVFGLADCRRFEALKGHFVKHGDEIGAASPSKYRAHAFEHIDRVPGTKIYFEGENRIVHVSRIEGTNSVLLTATDKSGKTVFTHHTRSIESLKNIGIAEPKNGFPSTRLPRNATPKS